MFILDTYDDKKTIEKIKEEEDRLREEWDARYRNTQPSQVGGGLKSNVTSTTISEAQPSQLKTNVTSTTTSEAQPSRVDGGLKTNVTSTTISETQPSQVDGGLESNATSTTISETQIFQLNSNVTLTAISETRPSQADRGLKSNVTSITILGTQPSQEDGRLKSNVTSTIISEGTSRWNKPKTINKSIQLKRLLSALKTPSRNTMEQSGAK